MSALNARCEGGIVKFPAFVRLPAAGRPEIRQLLTANENDYVKCITLSARTHPFSVESSRIASYRQQIASRWGISEDKIRAITVNFGGRRVLIENSQDWDDWVGNYFEHIPRPPERQTYGHITYSPYSQIVPDQGKKTYSITPVHINILLDAPNHSERTAGVTASQPVSTAGPQSSASAATARPPANEPPTYSEASPANNITQPSGEAVNTVLQAALSLPTANTPQLRQPARSSGPTPPSTSAPQPPTSQDTRGTSNPPTAETVPQANRTSPPAPGPTSTRLSSSTMANDLVGSILQAIQPALQEISAVHSSLFSALNAQQLGAPGTLSAGSSLLSTMLQATAAHPAQQSSSAASAQSQASAAPSRSAQASTTNPAANTQLPASANPSVPTEAAQPPSAALSTRTAAGEAASSTTGSQQRQSLFEGMFDELSRLRAQQAHTYQVRQQPHPAPPPAVSQQSEGEMSTELGNAFAEMLSRQRSATTVLTESDGDEESLTMVSTPSSSSSSSSSPQRSPRPRTRSRSATRRARRAFLSSTTLTLLTLFTFLITLITPSFATPTSLNPHSLLFRDVDPITPRQNSRHLHLCKCTCFQTNSTLVPLYSPVDPAKPCTTCTRQFCLDQGLEVCKGAKLEHTDHDVGTGLEGDVWAKCFEREGYKDQSIITLYILVVVGLVGYAAMRGRLGGWVEQYQTMGPQGLYQAVRESPWRRAGSR